MNRLNGNGKSLNEVFELEAPRLLRRDVKKSWIESYSHQLLEQIGPIRCVGKDWFRYKSGVWQEIEEDIFMPTAWKLLNNRNERNVKQLLDAIRAQTQIMREQFFGAIKAEGDSFLINCANGVIRVNQETGEAVLEGHSKKHMFTLQIASNYTNTKPRIFLSTLHRVLPAVENRRLLLDYATSCLIPDSRFERMLFCTGSGGNGKSTIWEAIAEALGYNVVSAVSYHDICDNNRKYVWKLEKKLLNFATETRTEPIKDNAIIRAIVSGEPFETDRMYRDSFTMQTNVKLVFAINNLMRYEQGSDGDIRRISLIHFGEHFEATKEFLEIKNALTQERHSIFSMLVRRLTKTLRLSTLPDGDETSQKAHEQFRCANNSINEFAKKCLQFGEGSYEKKQDLWEGYKQFSKNFQFSPHSQEYFFRKLYANFPNLKLNEDRTMIEGERTYIIRNVKLVASKVGNGRHMVGNGRQS